ncbi:hypothetical protein Q3G72_028321 [Acer saccharum]|nr:hypothetical protein Q3G72_028321 [Acer saccharum]
MKDCEKSSIGVCCPGFAMKDSKLLDCEIIPGTLEGIFGRVKEENLSIFPTSKVDDSTRPVSSHGEKLQWDGPIDVDMGPSNQSTPHIHRDVYVVCSDWTVPYPHQWDRPTEVFLLHMLPRKLSIINVT